MEYQNQAIENLLQKFKAEIGPDYDKYKNHVQRVFLICMLIDDDKSNQEKYAIASVFHDIGIWTNQTFDYLEPSIEQARIHLIKIGREDWLEEITLMISWHHKITMYRGNHEHIVENFRKADWIDVSFGLISFGVDKKKIKENIRKWPTLGFHRFLVKASLKEFFRHPFNPLPMIKK
jgi:hypothetical protein